jgi:DNA polymerase bacteriophage-type
MNYAVIDWETRSACDLGKCGAAVYAEHETTEATCLAVAVNDRLPFLWVPPKFCALSGRTSISVGELVKVLLSMDLLVAQYSLFEYFMWNGPFRRDHGAPELPLEKLFDTKALLAYHALPLSLDEAGKALGLKQKKDEEGHALMLKMCKPRSDGTYLEDRDSLNRLFAYALRDVEAEREIYQKLPPLPESELRIWQFDQRVNARGFYVDHAAISKITRAVKRREKELIAEFQVHVNKEVSGPRSHKKFKEWVNQKTGLELTSIDKNAVKEVLTRPDLPANVRAAIEVKAEIAKSGVAKFEAMRRGSNSDGRVRSCYVYGGASTLRWTASRVQPHNFQRDCYDTDWYDHVVDNLHDRELTEALYGNIFAAAARCIRGTVRAAPGKKYLGADFKSVESRGLAWLCYDEDALDIHRSGKDPYKYSAVDIFGVPYDEVTSAQRQVAKGRELGAQYRGGIGALANTAKIYGVDLETIPEVEADPDEIEAATFVAKMFLALNPGAMPLKTAIKLDLHKRRWRQSRPLVARHWDATENAAKMAVINPGRPFAVDRVVWRYERPFLTCLLPSGRVINYYKPMLLKVKTPWGVEKVGLTYLSNKAKDNGPRKFQRVITHGGKLTENETQAACRDVLAWAAAFELEPAGFEIVLHTHDDVVAEVPINDKKLTLEYFEEKLTKVHKWMEGLPIEADGWEGPRFRK